MPLEAKIQIVIEDKQRQLDESAAGSAYIWALNVEHRANHLFMLIGLVASGRRAAADTFVTNLTATRRMLLLAWFQLRKKTKVSDRL